MARSSTCIIMFGTTTLIIEISWRAAFLPNLSIFQAAWSVRRRAWSISMRESADPVLHELLLAEHAAEGDALCSRSGT